MSSTSVMPSEWAPQQAVLLTWPHAGTDWCEILDEVEPVFFEIAKSVLRFQNLIVSCEDPERLKKVESQLHRFIQDQDVAG
ncbi:MAG: agmatine deiminase family protein, partial [Marinobacter sp.]|nr:agmatine deiminase family protein [Marinobacter sp.]